MSPTLVSCSPFKKIQVLGHKIYYEKINNEYVIPYLLEYKTKFFPEIWCSNLQGYLKFEYKNRTALHHTRLLWTGPCEAKSWPASPNHHVRSSLFWDIMQRWVVIHYKCTGRNYCSHLQRSRNPNEQSMMSNFLKKHEIVALFQFAGKEASNLLDPSSSPFQLGLEHTLQMHCSQEAYCATLFRRSHFRHQSVLLVHATWENPW